MARRSRLRRGGSLFLRKSSCRPSLRRAKVERIRSYGADLVVAGDSYADALRASERWAATTDALTIHAFDQEETILGQGTLGLELEGQAPDVDTVLVSVGGGGLIAGLAAWYGRRLRLVWRSSRRMRPR